MPFEVGFSAVWVIGLDAERLVGRNDNASVLSGIACRRGGRVGSEDIVQRPEGLSSQLVTIADEEGASQLARFRERVQDTHRDPRLPGTCGEREERATLASRDALQHCPLGRALIVALSLAGRTQQRVSGRGVYVNAAHFAISGEQVVGGWKATERQRPTSLVGVEAMLDEQDAVRGKGERDVMRTGVALRLFESFKRGTAFGLGFYQRDRESRLIGSTHCVQDVVGATAGTAGTIAPDDGLPRRDFAPNGVLGPPALVQGRRDQLRPGVGF